MWVDLTDKNQVAIIGEKSKAYGMGKRKRTFDKEKLLSELCKSNISLYRRNSRPKTLENDPVTRGKQFPYEINWRRWKLPLQNSI